MESVAPPCKTEVPIRTKPEESAVELLQRWGGRWLLSGRSRRRRVVEEMVEAAHRWGGGDLHYRLPESDRPRNLEPLVRALNLMAASLAHREEVTRLRADERITHTERLATVGRLAAGVAHEMNNPLGGILLSANLLIESTAPDDPRRSNMERIVAQTVRAREIVRGLLDFSRQSPSRIDRIDLNGLVEDVLALMERHPKMQNVRVEVQLCPIPLWVHVDARKIEQVLVNTVMNALDAMRGGGTLTLRSGFSDRNGFCRVAITDTGPGIREEHMGRVFDPFFTTKDVGHGVGLGLAISYGIVQEHKGEIEVQSVVGSGTTFRILLPVERTEP